jgi:hypothetical protein
VDTCESFVGLFKNLLFRFTLLFLHRHYPTILVKIQFLNYFKGIEGKIISVENFMFHRMSIFKSKFGLMPQKANENEILKSVAEST